MSIFSKKPAEEPQNIDEILEQFKELKNQHKALSEEMKTLRAESIRNISKVGVVRFNPFEGFGGNQSFSIAILDGENNGAIITSLFSRDGNRVYGKPVKNGTSSYPLSEEESKAIEVAQNIQNSKS